MDLSKNQAANIMKNQVLNNFALKNPMQTIQLPNPTNTYVRDTALSQAIERAIREGKMEKSAFKYIQRNRAKDQRKIKLSFDLIKKLEEGKKLTKKEERDLINLGLETPLDREIRINKEMEEKIESIKKYAPEKYQKILNDSMLPGTSYWSTKYVPSNKLYSEEFNKLLKKDRAKQQLEEETSEFPLDPSIIEEYGHRKNPQYIASPIQDELLSEVINQGKHQKGMEIILQNLVPQTEGEFNKFEKTFLGSRTAEILDKMQNPKSVELSDNQLYDLSSELIGEIDEEYPIETDELSPLIITESIESLKGKEEDDSLMTLSEIPMSDTEQIFDFYHNQLIKRRSEILADTFAISNGDVHKYLSTRITNFIKKYPFEKFPSSSGETYEDKTDRYLFQMDLDVMNKFYSWFKKNTGFDLNKPFEPDFVAVKSNLPKMGRIQELAQILRLINKPEAFQEAQEHYQQIQGEGGSAKISSKAMSLPALKPLIEEYKSNENKMNNTTDEMQLKKLFNMNERVRRDIEKTCRENFGEESPIEYHTHQVYPGYVQGEFNVGQYIYGVPGGNTRYDYPYMYRNWGASTWPTSNMEPIRLVLKADPKTDIHLINHKVGDARYTPYTKCIEIV